jgi:homoserine kinase
VWPADPRVVGDRLHEPARFAAMPATGAAVTELRTAGIHAWLSGAGPTIACVLRTFGDGAERTVGEVAARHGFVVHRLVVDLSGAVACPEGGCGIAGSGGCVRCPRVRV